MKQKAILLLLLIGLPIFIRLLPVGILNFKTFIYGAFLAMGIAVLTSRKVIIKISDPLMQFNVLFVGLLLLQFFIGRNYSAEFSLIQTALMPFLISIIIILYINSIRSGNILKIIDNVLIGLAIIFLIQFSLSLYEMYSGNPFILYGFLKTHTLDQNMGFYQSRSLLSLIGLNINAQFSLTMLIGHWNHSAPHLAIYNLVFLYLYLKTKKKIILVLPILVFVASLLNTTRAAIITLLITDVLFYFYLSGGKKKSILLFKRLLFIIGLYLVYLISISLYEFYMITDTLFSGRMEYYYVYLEYIRSNFAQSIVGFGLYEASLLGEKLRAMAGYTGGSFESYFFTIIFTNGLIGFYLFIRLIYNIYNNSLRFKNKANMGIFKLLAINIILTSLTLGGITSIFTYPILTVLYMNIKYTEKYNVLT